MFLSISLLNFGFTQEKRRDSVVKDELKWSTDGHAAADELQTKNKKYDTCIQHIHFIHSGEKNGHGWRMTRKRV